MRQDAVPSEGQDVPNVPPPQPQFVSQQERHEFDEFKRQKRVAEARALIAKIELSATSVTYERSALRRALKECEKLGIGGGGGGHRSRTGYKRGQLGLCKKRAEKTETRFAQGNFKDKFRGAAFDLSGADPPSVHHLRGRNNLCAHGRRSVRKRCRRGGPEAHQGRSKRQGDDKSGGS